ncbi:DUF4817 domain-containing protein [Trichonephila clavipes]|nr:DUF4817 domain-containing protein [Trichonephila clavipes]
MSRFGGLSEERPSVFKTRSKLGTHLSTQCSGDERQSRPCEAPLIEPQTCGVLISLLGNPVTTFHSVQRERPRKSRKGFQSTDEQFIPVDGLVESFFKNDEGHNVTVNGDRYRAMITNFFIPELNNHDVQELWFQQDGATCHTAFATIDLLKDTFGDRLISHFVPVNWPPRSCDLTPLEYFL